MLEKVYTRNTAAKKLPWGTQEEPVVPGTIDFVAPSSSGLVRMKIDEIIQIYAEIPELLKTLR